MLIVFQFFICFLRRIVDLLKEKLKYKSSRWKTVWYRKDYHLMCIWKMPKLCFSGEDVQQATRSQTLRIPWSATYIESTLLALVNVANSLCSDFDCSWMSHCSICRRGIFLPLHPSTPPLFLSFLSSPWQQETSGRLSRLTRLVDVHWQIPTDHRKQEERTLNGDDRLRVSVNVCVRVLLGAVYVTIVCKMIERLVISVTGTSIIPRVNDQRLERLLHIQCNFNLKPRC